MVQSIKLAVVVVGPIGSGKSEVSKHIVSNCGGRLVSFGTLVRSECEKRQLSHSRATYQDVGLELFRSLGPGGIVGAALGGHVPHTLTVFDGVRHITVLEDIRSRFSHTFVLALKASKEECYRRYLMRSPDERISLQDFDEICAHPIEVGIEELCRHADLVIDAERQLPEACAVALQAVARFTKNLS